MNPIYSDRTGDSLVKQPCEKCARLTRRREFDAVTRSAHSLCERCSDTYSTRLLFLLLLAAVTVVWAVQFSR